MKTVRLHAMTLSNFKGISAGCYDFAGRSSAVYGANGTGKTTLADAWMWLVTGKNSRGLSDFTIKPTSERDGERDTGVITSVSAEITVDDVPHTLRRDYYEKWSQKRGSVEKTFDGNTTDFFIDGAAMKKAEYDAAVRELVAPEDVFLLISRLTGFCDSLTWQKRREILFSLIPMEHDAALMARDGRFAPLADALGAGTLDALRRKLSGDKKRLAGEKTAMPGRIEEVAAMIESLSGIDYQSLRSQLSELTARRDTMAAELAADKEREALQTLQAKEAERLHREALARQAEAECDITGLIEKRQTLRDRYASVYASKLPDDELTCPTCGRACDAEARNAAAERFEKDKQTRLQEIAADGKAVGEQIETAKKRLAELTANAEKTASGAALSAMPCTRIEQPMALADISRQIADISEKLGGAAVLDNAKSRLHDLEETARRIASELEACERLLWLADEFTRYKATFIEDGINSRFRQAKFKLFERQVNGTLADCCMATYQGVPYEDINTSMRMNLGLDIIETISRHYGANVPLFCDNAESVSEWNHTDAQTIRLYVSERDKELRIETIETEGLKK